MTYNNDKFGDNLEKVLQFIVYCIILGTIIFLCSGCKSKSHIVKDYYDERHDSIEKKTEKTEKKEVYTKSNVLFTIEEGVMDVVFGDSGKIEVGSDGLKLSGVKGARMRGNKHLSSKDSSNYAKNENNSLESNVSVSDVKKSKHSDSEKVTTSKPSIDITTILVVISLIIIAVCYIYIKRNKILQFFHSLL